MKLFTCGLLMMSVMLVGCRPDQEETNYNEMDLIALNNGGSEQECALIDDLDSCEASPICQPLFEPGGTTENDYISCIEYAQEDPAPEEPASEEEGEMAEGSGSEDVGSSSDDSSANNDYDTDDDESSADLADYACDSDDDSSSSDNKKVIVCHIPPGNSGAAHSICISENGWLNGHQDRHQGNVDDSSDYLGECKKSDAEDDDSSSDDSSSDDDSEESYDDDIE